MFSDEVYLNKPWFLSLKQRWLTNFDSLEKFYMKIKIRFNETGETTVKYERYPQFLQGGPAESWSLDVTLLRLPREEANVENQVRGAVLWLGQS
jgi:hypothetical protein